MHSLLYIFAIILFRSLCFLDLVLFNLHPLARFSVFLLLFFECVCVVQTTECMRNNLYIVILNYITDFSEVNLHSF